MSPAASDMATISPPHVSGKMIDGHQPVGSRRGLILSYEQPPTLGIL